MTRIAYDAEQLNASGPYSNAIDAGNFIYFSGQTAMNSAGGAALKGDIGKQTEQCFSNLFAVLEASGLTSDDVVKVNVFLTDMNHFQAMNAVYQTKFNPPYPARTCVAVMALPLGAEVEIEMVARKNS